jgi:decaprenyl-phosphate phosphoribosyltransferase
MNLLKLLRIKHYIKNGLIFLPLFFSLQFLNAEAVRNSIIGFIIFSFSASIIYIINDIKDVQRDRQHPIKKNRPIASGAVSIKQAYAVAFLLGLLSTLLIVVNSINAFSVGLILLYLLINIAYSWGLKDLPLLDVLIIASGFIIRVVLGGSLIDQAVSSWLILTIMAFSFYLAFGKRRNELSALGNTTRHVLNHYTSAFLDKAMQLTLSLFVVFYALWSISDNPSLSDSRLLVWSIPIVLLIIFRYSIIIETSESYGDPADVLFSDAVLLVLSFLYVLYMTLIYSGLI